MSLSIIIYRLCVPVIKLGELFFVTAFLTNLLLVLMQHWNRRLPDLINRLYDLAVQLNGEQYNQLIITIPCLKAIKCEVINSYFVPKHAQDRPDLSHLCKALSLTYPYKRNMRSCMSPRIQSLCILLFLHSASDIQGSLLDYFCLLILVLFH